MAETAPEPAPEVPAESPEGETPSVSELNQKVDSIIETLKKIVAPGGDAPHEAEAEAEGPSVAAEVRAELAKLRQAEDRKAAREKRDSDIDELKETVKKIKERPPKEYRKVTQAVWGRDED